MDEYYPACVWNIEKEGVYITFSNFKLNIYGGLLLCKMIEVTSKNEFIYNHPQKIKGRFIEALQKGIGLEQTVIKIESKESFEEYEVVASPRISIPPEDNNEKYSNFRFSLANC